MCGIAGIMTFNERPNVEELKEFTLALHHRGPDGYGLYNDDRVGLGHTRLAILDLSEAGKCPMQYIAPDGRELQITFNGEIYNFLELRKELEALGHRFKSQSDTEVITAAYAQWGENCLYKFNGMWAFAIWDKANQTLFIARDRFGVKPLYYLVSNRFAFASELKAFLKLKNFERKLHPEMAKLAISHSYAYEGSVDETLLTGVRRLRGGQKLTINSSGKIQIGQWWNTFDHLPTVPRKYEDQVATFKELFIDAVCLRMRADVPVGTCLSGGVDSSAVCSTMAWAAKEGRFGQRCAPEWQRSVIATFPGSPIDEKQYADEVIRHTGAQPIYWEFKSEEAIKDIVGSVWSMEDVYGGIGVSAWSVYRELRRNKIVVSLDGHGGDELLGGYPWYLDQPIGGLNRKLAEDFHITLLPAILRNYDRCSAAHGIEVRMPIMDYRLVTLAMALPGETKVGGGYTKRIFRDAMKGIMPEKIRTRRQKIGFNAPMVEWFNLGLNGLAEQVMSEPFWNSNPFFNGKQITESVLPRIRAKSFAQRDWNDLLTVWTHMNLTLWNSFFIEGRMSDYQKMYT